MNDILHYMYQDGQISAKELSSLRKTCRELHESPVRVLRSLNISNPEEIQASLQRAFHVPAITDRLVASLDESFKALIPIDIALHYSVFAIAEDNENLHVAMEDPSDKGTIHRLEFFLNRRIVPAAATVNQIADALSRLYDALPEQMKLTTSIESSRGVVAGIKNPDVPAEIANAAQTLISASSAENTSTDEESAVQSLTERAVAADTSSLDSFEDDSFSTTESSISEQPADTGMSFEELSSAGQSLEAAPSDETTAPTNAAPKAELDFSGLEPGGIVELGDPLGLSSEDTPTPISTDKSSPNLTQETLASGAAADSVFTSLDMTKEHMAPGDVVLFDNFTPPAAPVVDTTLADLPTDDMLAADLPAEDMIAEEVTAPIAPEELATSSRGAAAQDLGSLKLGINACLIKLSLAKNRQQAIEIINSKLSDCALSLTSNEDGSINAHFNETDETFVLDELAQQTNPSDLQEVLFPLLKRLAKLK